MSLALGIYHRFPPVSRSLAATIRGYYLRWWRYDNRTEGLIDEILERDSWSERQWAEWRSERVGRLLERAATQIPYYRRIWAERRRNGDRASWSYLENWPILEKRELRSHSREFVADDRSTRWMFHDHTSGTTGSSLDVWLSRSAVIEWYAMFEARWRRWYGLTRHDRWAILGGQMVAPTRQTKPPFWVWNAGLNQLYMSSYHLSPSLMHHYLDALVHHRVRYIWSYSSAAYVLALEILRQKRKDIRVELVITNAEPLYDHQRDAISAAFNCPVRETYGMSEIVAAASECNRGKLHQWPDAGIIEVGQADSKSAFGDFLCTGLVNFDMPLIRYRVGDSGALSNDRCDCGKRLPLIKKIQGRTDDMLHTLDGRIIGRLDTVFKNNVFIVEAQIVQESLERLLVRYVPDKNFTSESLSVLARRLRDRMGNVEVTFEECSKIPRTNAGKFRAVICQVPGVEKSSLESN